MTDSSGPTVSLSHKGKKRPVDEGSSPTNRNPKKPHTVPRTARHKTVARRIQLLDDEEAREKVKSTFDPRKEMDMDHPELYSLCERDPPWSWTRKRHDNTYLRKEWPENPDWSRWFKRIYLDDSKCRTYHSQLSLGDLICGTNPTVPIQDFELVDSLIPKLALLNTDTRFKIVDRNKKGLLHYLPGSLIAYGILTWKKILTLRLHGMVLNV